jgi:hypothetical protein
MKITKNLVAIVTSTLLLGMSYGALQIQVSANTRKIEQGEKYKDELFKQLSEMKSDVSFIRGKLEGRK